MSKFRKYLLVLIDAGVLGLACLTAFVITGLLTADNPEIFASSPIFLLFIVCCIPSMAALGVYRTIWRYAVAKDFLNLAGSLAAGGAVCAFILMILNRPVSGTMFLFTFMLAFFLVPGSRMVYQLYCSMYFKRRACETGRREPTMIVGEVLSCRGLLIEMMAADCHFKPVCIVNDNQEKIGRYINGVAVYGPVEAIPELCKRLSIENIIFAASSYDLNYRKRVISICSSTNCRVKILPCLYDTVMDNDLFGRRGDINVENLLGRKTIEFESCDVYSYIRDQVCMVTGGGGSIGSELCRQIAKYKPRRLIIVDCYENNAYEIQQELTAKYGKALNLSVQIASVRDFVKMDKIFRAFKPAVVFHAAAHKHVPLMENNPEEAVKNNILGTFQLANIANLYYVKKFVLVSTDKAVNPTSVMGATKRCCEMIMQYMTEQTEGTDFITVRFGNVLGSNGSVIPLFKKQIESGGPVTITHPDIIRYFMTIPEAVSLIMQAGAMAHGGEIFVLDMGEPVRIVALAENLIRQYGKEPYRDIPIEFTGLRPGEKLFEELLMSEEGLESTMNNKIFIGSQIPVDCDDFIMRLQALKEVLDSGDKSLIIRRLKDIVPTFRHEALIDPEVKPSQNTAPLPEILVTQKTCAV